ncbi:MAG: carbon storage regulator [Chloroflexi bacterium]|jgi:carbon storage regulator|nr:carbon storage regulator [Chloroflexota bacterium]
MLILVRKVQQGIWIEGDIWVTVLSVERDRVKLGISAPGDVKVMRRELIAEVENPGVRDKETTPSS